MKNVASEFRVNIIQRQQINMNTKDLFKLNLDGSKIKQRSAGKGVYQDIEVAALSVLSPDNRTKDARIARAIGFKV